MAQDVIFRANYDTINAKVLTVNDDEVTYKLADYADGPVFSLFTDDIIAIQYANGAMQYFDAIPEDEKTEQKPANILTNYGNSYFYAGQEISRREMLDWYARQNCRAAYDQFLKGSRMATAGWVFLGIGAAMDIGAVTCIGVMINHTNSTNSTNQAPALSENPTYTPNPLRPAAIGLTFGALAFEAACVPLLVVGYHKMHSSAEIYNMECNTASSWLHSSPESRPYASRKSRPYASPYSMPYWTLQTSGNGLGLALNF